MCAIPILAVEYFFFFQAEDGIRDKLVTGVQTCALPISNEFAPEHCEVMTKSAAKLVPRIKTAGAIFLGPWSPTVAGDYVAGPSHVLPTGGGDRESVV